MNAAKQKILGMDVLSQAAGCVKTIAHPCRLRIIEMLLDGEYTVGELAEACEIPNHMASEHLGLMRDRGLLVSERRGREIYYSVAKQGLEHIIECVRSHF